jgi:hypothetical protein
LNESFIDLTHKNKEKNDFAAILTEKWQTPRPLTYKKSKFLRKKITPHHHFPHVQPLKFMK